jgi:NADPH:quinone reductase-like Zn-dependent oxidoreductase
MKAWMLDTTDLTLSPKEMAQPEPGPHQMRVRVRSAAMNRGEFVHLPKQTARFKVAGIEAAGVVEAVGEGVVRFAPGDRVMGRAIGGFAELALIDQRDAMHVPANLSWHAAAALPIAAWVAYDMVMAEGALQQGETMLVAGIASGVGVACLQIAKALGARVVGTSGSPAKLDRLRELGLDLGIATRGGDFVDEVAAFAGPAGVNLAIDSVGGTPFPACLACLGYMGRLAGVGYVDGVFKTELDLAALHRKRLKIFGVSNAMRTAAQREATVSGFVRDVLPWVAEGRIVPLIDRVLPFEQTPEALQAMLADVHVGKIVVEVSAD